jgi:hypothetical protein
LTSLVCGSASTRVVGRWLLVVDQTDVDRKIVRMLSLDTDPGDEPRPDEEPSQGLDTEDELAEDLISSPSQGLEVEDQLEGAFVSSPPEDEEDGGGMDTEHETRSPARSGTRWLLESSRR